MRRYLLTLLFLLIGGSADGVTYRYDNPIKELGVDFMPTEQLDEYKWVGWLHVPEFGKKGTAVFAFLRRNAPGAEYNFGVEYVDNDKSVSYDTQGVPQIPELSKLIAPYPKMPLGLFRTEHGPIVNGRYQTYQWDPKTKKWAHRQSYGRREELQEKDREYHPSKTIREAFESQQNKPAQPKE